MEPDATKRDVPHSPLLNKLPPEIRNEIWRLALQSPTGSITIIPSAIRRYTPLLNTCRQIREEATSIFYGENTFSTHVVIGGSNTLRPWLHSIGRANAGRIRSLHTSISVASGVLLWGGRRRTAGRSKRRAQGNNEWVEVELIRAWAGNVARSIVGHGVRATRIKGSETQHLSQSSADLTPARRLSQVRWEFEVEVRRMAEDEKVRRLEGDQGERGERRRL